MARGFWTGVKEFLFGKSPALPLEQTMFTMGSPPTPATSSANSTAQPRTAKSAAIALNRKPLMERLAEEETKATAERSGKGPVHPTNIELTITGKGRRAKFSAMAPVSCKCGATVHIPAIGIDDGTEVSCPACTESWTIGADLAAEIEDELQDLIDEAVFDMDIDLDDDEDDVIHFIIAKGRFPKKSERGPKGYPVNLVGEQYCQDAVERCKAGERVTLFREIGNPHDPDAIVVVSTRGEAIGYVPRDSFVQRVVHDENKGCRATIWKLESGARGFCEVALDLSVVATPIGEQRYSR